MDAKIMTTQHLIHIDLVDSESRIFVGEVEYFVIDAYNGEMGIYPNHAPIVSQLKPGVLRVKLPQEPNHKVFAISGGFLEISNNQAIILIDRLERTDKLDEVRLIEQKNEALTKLNNKTETFDLTKTMLDLEIIIAQLKALQYIKQHPNNY